MSEDKQLRIGLVRKGDQVAVVNDQGEGGERQELFVGTEGEARAFQMGMAAGMQFLSDVQMGRPLGKG